MKATLDQNQLTPANLNQVDSVQTKLGVIQLSQDSVRQYQTSLAKLSQVKLVQTELDVTQLGQNTSN